MILPFLLGLTALIALFFKLPGVPELFGLQCASCSTATPYIPMLAAGYFAALCTTVLCFRTFPSRPLKWGGGVWAVGLAITLTALSPNLCPVCLLAHACHIALWVFWKPTERKPEALVGMKLSMVFTTLIASFALFSTLNFTFLVYGVKFKSPLRSLVKEGSQIALDIGEHQGAILHFISANCPYCKEQIPKLDQIAHTYQTEGLRFINISPTSIPELHDLGPHLEWVEDAALLSQLGIEGFPTMVVIDASGTVVKTLAGATANLDKALITSLESVSSTIMAQD